MRYIILAIFFASLSGFSQTISKQVIGPGGGVFDTGTNKLSYTTGEVVVGAMTSEDGSIQLGNRYYPSLDLSTLNTQSPELKLQVKVYPNPTTDYVVLKITDTALENLQYTIFDVNGKTIISKKITTSSTKITMKNYSIGMYLLKLTKENQPIKTFKIIKKQ